MTRRNGRITTWKDQQGFGFITPEGGGEPVFVHVSAFSTRNRRPAANDVVSYVVRRDAKGRANAAQVEFAASHAARRRPASAGNLPLYFTAFFAFLVGMLGAAGGVAWTVPAYYAAISVLTFAVYAVDKSAAVNGRRRVAEVQLHLIALAGGWPGALLAQRLLRHKTRKPGFQLACWTTVVLNCALLAWLSSAADGQAIWAAAPIPHLPA